MTADRPMSTQEWIAYHLAQAPPLTAEQRARLAILLRPNPVLPQATPAGKAA